MRILHSMIRVNNLEESIKFYSEVLGMKLLREKEYPEGKFSLAFLGYGNETETTVIELTYNWDTKDYEHGNAFGHIAIEVDDIGSKSYKRSRPYDGVKITFSIY